MLTLMYGDAQNIMYEEQGTAWRGLPPGMRWMPSASTRARGSRRHSASLISSLRRALPSISQSVTPREPGDKTLPDTGSSLSGWTKVPSDWDRDQNLYVGFSRALSHASHPLLTQQVPGLQWAFWLALALFLLLMNWHGSPRTCPPCPPRCRN